MENKDDFKDLNVGGKTPDFYNFLSKDDELFLTPERREYWRNFWAENEKKHEGKSIKTGSVVYLGTGGSIGEEALPPRIDGKLLDTDWQLMVDAELNGFDGFDDTDWQFWKKKHRLAKNRLKKLRSKFFYKRYKLI